MAVITQEYDVDLKATGWYPVVEMSQFDTGSRTIVLTVHDGKELVPLDGCVARIDGRRSDGVEFSASCTVGTGSRVSFTISQEMTRAAGKHVAELVIIDSAGDTVGTQNFILAVEPASMLRDAAASADDRTLYDQYTSSIESKFNSLSKDVNRTVEDISQAIGATSKPKVIINRSVAPDGYNFDVRMVYDPVTALVTLRVSLTYGVSNISSTSTYSSTLLQIPADYLPEASLFDPTNGYALSKDMMQPEGAGNSDPYTEYLLDASGNLIFKVWLPTGNPQWRYGGDCNVSWYARGGKYMGVKTIGTGGNTIKVGSVTTGAPGTNATVVNSGTAKDVVLDFAIPRGDKGEAGTGGTSYTLPAATSTTLGGIKVGSNLSITEDGTLSATGGTSSGFDPTKVDDIVIGSGATVGNHTGFVIGVKSSANNTGDMVVGNSAIASGSYSTAIGWSAQATGGRWTDNAGSEAIGSSAQAKAAGSVALGWRSIASEEFTVSVGRGGDDAGARRRIVNVGWPVGVADAANKAYVDALEAKLTALETRVAALESK